MAGVGESLADTASPVAMLKDEWCRWGFHIRDKILDSSSDFGGGGRGDCVSHIALFPLCHYIKGAYPSEF